MANYATSSANTGRFMQIIISMRVRFRSIENVTDARLDELLCSSLPRQAQAIYQIAYVCQTALIETIIHLKLHMAKQYQLAEYTGTGWHRYMFYKRPLNTRMRFDKSLALAHRILVRYVSATFFTDKSKICLVKTCRG